MRESPRPSYRIVALTVAVLAAVGGCTSSAPAGGSDPRAEGTAGWPASVERTIGEARRDGADAEQIAILEKAAGAGLISYEVYSAAVDQSLRCIRTAGLPVPKDEIATNEGLKIRLYSMPGDSQRPDPIADQCVKTHSWFVEKAYQLQPPAQEAKEQYFARYREALLNCVSVNGVAVDPDMTRGEIDRAVAQVMDQKGVDCLRQTGFSG